LISTRSILIKLWLTNYFVNFLMLIMERRDYLIHQIQEMGAFLVRLILRLKKEHLPSAQFEAVRAELEDELALKLDDVLFLEDQAFVDVLEEKLLSDENMLQFAFLLEQLGDVALEDETFLRQQVYYHKALALLVYVEHKSQNYSMERQQKIANLRAKLDNHSD